MALTTPERKALLARKGIRPSAIARHLGVSTSLVTHVIAGRRWMGTDSRRVIGYVCDALEQPIEEVFPDAWKDRSNGRPFRKNTAPDSAAAT